MKMRKGFVSNSSSSSFVLGKNFMTEEQITKFSEWLKEMESKPYNSEDTKESGFYETYIHNSKKYFHGEAEQADSDKIINKLEELGVSKDDYEFNC